jgi:dienelactone hydrolase
VNRTDANAPARAGQRRETSAHRRRRLAAGAVVIAALIGAAYAAVTAAAGPATGHPRHGGVGPGPTASTSAPRPRPTVHLAVGTIGGYAVAGKLVKLVERSPAAGRRVLHTNVLYPVIPPGAAGGGVLARGLFPLVVFAPGYWQCDGSYSALLHAWASAGYVVASVDFPVTNCHVRGPEGDLVNQPADMTYVIRQLVAISGQQGGQLAGLVNPAEIAVAGHSDGGDTVAALVGNTCCLDHKVVAAMVLSGGEFPALAQRGTYFPAGTPPILFVQGSADTVNPPSASMLMYQADTGTRFYLNLYGASHLAPYEGTQLPEPIVARVTTDFLNRYVAGQHPAGAAMTRAGNVPGMAQLVHGGRLPS